jgi:transcriptional regulator with XRE-family HTH domain
MPKKTIAKTKFSDLGQRLRMLRGKLSQKDFSRRVEVPLRSYQRYEKGEIAPPFEIIEKIISKLGGISMPWVITGTMDPVVPISCITSDNMEYAARRSVVSDEERANFYVLDPESHTRLVRIFKEGDAAKVHAIIALLHALDPGPAKKYSPKKTKSNKYWISS